MTLEVSLEKRACGYLFEHGANPIKRGMNGEPDREILWGAGLHFWIEFKKEDDGKERPAQVLWRKYLKAIGDDHYLVERFIEVVEIVALWELIYGRATADRDAAFNPTRKRA